MRIREDLPILGSEFNFNIYTLSENSLKPYMLESKDVNYLKILIRAFSQVETNVLVNTYLDKVIFINYLDYPLPGFCMKDYTPVVNLGPLGYKFLSDLQMADVYSIFVYSTLFANYMENKPFKDSLIDHIVLFIFNTLMLKYGKSSGLVGSFKNHIPKLKLLIYFYVYDGLFGNTISKLFISKIANKVMIPYEGLKLDYDFSKFDECLKAIRDNRIMSISDNVFIKDFIEIGYINCLPMFIDVSRLFCTLVASSVRGNNVFSTYWRKKSPHIYEKLLFFGTKSIKLSK